MASPRISEMTEARTIGDGVAGEKSGEVTEEEVERGTKLNPKSAFSEGECSSRDELLKACFTNATPVTNSPVVGEALSVVESSSSSSPGSSSSSVVSEGAGKHSEEGAKAGECLLSESASELQPLYSFLSDGSRVPIRLSTESRAGRDHQRWEHDRETSTLIRLVTGCVPITNDGRILFISSAKKREWILPKGGWESDETMEKSALRETYEEGGILGTLGPPLSQITFETRKAKKRRLERLENTKRAKSNDEIAWSTSSCCASSEDELNTIGSISPVNSFFSKNIPQTPDQEPKYAGICRMTLFPLYITEVLDKWPESGRARKVFSIEEAIEVVTRPELKTVLAEVQRKGLHLVLNSAE